MSTEFIEGNRPIRVVFDIPIYQRALLQQNKQLPSEVTAEDMTELLLEKSKHTLRVKLWEFELEDFEEDEDKSLLKLVNNSLKMRDVEFEARRLLNLPETIPPQFNNPGSLTEQQETLGSKLLGPVKVVIVVVPKFLQATKAVQACVTTALSTMVLQVPFSHSIRDKMVLVLSMQEKVGQDFGKDVLVKRLNCFAVILQLKRSVCCFSLHHSCFVLISLLIIHFY
ncbi:hypothetical protein Q5P01_006350 [Channa striata]|uniref:Uncharacterized protein n=1 Tax=Channa striata TaxID=64152 RepID=A0AA88NE57_CHASR|nr:hypothetical protein Q5P01_006350 [Channa striata]